MDKLYKGIKYGALVFFLGLLILASYKKVTMVQNSEFVKGVYLNGQVAIKDNEKQIKLVKVIDNKQYENEEVYNVFYDKSKNEAHIFEFGSFTRDILILILVNGLCIMMIALDKSKKPN